MKKKLIAFALVLSMVTSMLPVTFATNGFSDMPSDYSTDSLENAVENGLLTGNNGKIMPEDDLTRAQMATILVRAFGAEEISQTANFNDVTEDDWFYSDILKAVQMGIFQGDGNSMNPNDAITREEAFVVLARAFSLTADKNATLDQFGDANLVSDWAYDYVLAMVETGYVAGDGQNLNPQNNIIRKDFAVIMDRMIETYVKEASTITEIDAGSVMVSTSDTTLKDITIDGNLIIGDGVSDGEVTLDGITVTGTTLIRGGGENSIYAINGSDLGDVIINNVNNAVALKMSEESTAKSITILSDDVVITGVLDGVEIFAQQDVSINGETISAGETYTVTDSSTTTSSTSSSSSSGSSSSSSSSSNKTTSIVFDQDSYNVTAGISLDLSDEITRNESASDTITYTSSDDTIAIFTDGVVSAKQVGSVTVTATANGISATATVEISNPTSFEYTITEAGTILEDCIFTTLTIDENVGTGDYTLIDCVVSNLITNGGGANSGYLSGGRYAEINMNFSPEEGSRFALSNGVIIGTINATDNGIIEVVSGEATISKVSSDSELEVKNAQINEITTSSSLLIDESSTIGEIIAVMASEIEVLGEIASIKGTVAEVILDGTGTTLISADTSTIIVKGETELIVEGNATNIEIFTSEETTTNISINSGSPNIITTGESAVNSLFISGEAAPTFDEDASIDTLITTSSSPISVPDGVENIIVSEDAGQVESNAYQITADTFVLDNIMILNTPTQITYTVDDTELNLTGLIVTANYTLTSGLYSYQTSNTVSDYIVSGFSAGTVGTQTITVTFDGSYSTFDITVVAKEISSISLASKPTKYIYEVGESLDTAGLSILVTYTDFNYASETITTGFETSGFDSETIGTKTITVTYDEKTTTFTVSVTLDNTIVAAIEEISSYYGENETVDSYSTENQAVIAEICLTYSEYIKTATTIAQIEDYIVSAKSQIDDVSTIAETAIADLQTAIEIAQNIDFTNTFEKNELLNTDGEIDTEIIKTSVIAIIEQAIDYDVIDVDVDFVYDQDESTFTITGIDLTIDDYQNYAEVTINNVIKIIDTKYTVTVDTTIYGEFSVGEIVSVTADEISGKTFTGWIVSGVTVTDLTANPLTFAMPSEDVTLSATYDEDIYQISLVVVGQGFLVTNVTSAKEGDTIIVETTPVDGYYLYELGYFANGVYFEINDDIFIMPPCDITIQAEYAISVDDTEPLSYIVTSIEIGLDGNGFPALEYAEPTAKTDNDDWEYRVKFYNTSGNVMKTHISDIRDNETVVSTFIDLHHQMASCTQIVIETIDSATDEVLGTGTFDVSIEISQTTEETPGVAQVYTTDEDYILVLDDLNTYSNYVIDSEYTEEYDFYNVSSYTQTSSNDYLEITLFDDEFECGRIDLVEVDFEITSSTSVTFEYKQGKTLYWDIDDLDSTGGDSAGPVTSQAVTGVAFEIINDNLTIYLTHPENQDNIDCYEVDFYNGDDLKLTSYTYDGFVDGIRYYDFISQNFDTVIVYSVQYVDGINDIILASAEFDVDVVISQDSTISAPTAQFDGYAKTTDQWDNEYDELYISSLTPFQNYVFEVNYGSSIYRDVIMADYNGEATIQWIGLYTDSGTIEIREANTILSGLTSATITYSSSQYLDFTTESFTDYNPYAVSDFSFSLNDDGGLQLHFTEPTDTTDVSYYDVNLSNYDGTSTATFTATVGTSYVTFDMLNDNSVNYNSISVDTVSYGDNGPEILATTQAVNENGTNMLFYITYNDTSYEIPTAEVSLYNADTKTLTLSNLQAYYSYIVGIDNYIQVYSADKNGDLTISMYDEITGEAQIKVQEYHASYPYTYMGLLNCGPIQEFAYDPTVINSADYEVPEIWLEQDDSHVSSKISYLVLGEPTRTDEISYYAIEYYEDGEVKATGTAVTYDAKHLQAWTQLEFGACTEIVVKSMGSDNEVLASVTFNNITIENTQNTNITSATIEPAIENNGYYDIPITISYFSSYIFKVFNSQGELIRTYSTYSNNTTLFTIEEIKPAEIEGGYIEVTCVSSGTVYDNSRVSASYYTPIKLDFLGVAYDVNTENSDIQLIASSYAEGQIAKFQALSSDWTKVVKDIVITDADGNNIEYFPVLDEQMYAFYMPSSDVTISGTSETKSYISYTHDKNLNSAPYFISCYSNYYAGQTAFGYIENSYSDDNDKLVYILYDVYYTIDNDETQTHYPITAYDIQSYDDMYGKWSTEYTQGPKYSMFTYTFPDSAYTVHATYTTTSDFNIMYVDGADGFSNSETGNSVAVGYLDYADSDWVGTTYFTANEKLYFYPSANYGYKVTDFTVKYADGTDVEIINTFEEDLRTRYVIEPGDKDIYFDIQTEAVNKHTMSINSAEEFYDFTYTQKYTLEFYEDAYVTVNFDYVEGCEVTSAYYYTNNDPVNGTKQELTFIQINSGYSNRLEYKFIMPGYDIDFYFDIVPTDGYCLVYRGYSDDIAAWPFNSSNISVEYGSSEGDILLKTASEAFVVNVDNYTNKTIDRVYYVDSQGNEVSAVETDADEKIFTFESLPEDIITVYIDYTDI